MCVEAVPAANAPKVTGDPEPGDLSPVSPSADVRAHLVEFLKADDSRLGQVYRAQQRGLSAEAIAGELGVSTSNFTWNQSRIVRALLDGDLPMAPTVAQAVAQKFRQMLRSGTLDAPVRIYLQTNLRLLEQRAGETVQDRIEVQETRPRLKQEILQELVEPERLQSVEEVLRTQITASFDAESLRKLATSAPHHLEISRRVYLSIVSAIQSGKHVILTGPPGTAKTTLATLTCKLASESGLCSGYQLTTATADWTTYETIGGLRPSKSDGSLEFQEGLFLNAIKAEQWLVIDELNRSNFDRAFGQLFTVLSGQSVVLPYEEPKSKKPIALVLEAGADDYSTADYAVLRVPKAWRIVSTMNVFDKSLLFEMSFALMRRFAFIEVASPSAHAYSAIWRRSLEGLPDESQERIDHILMDLLRELHPMKDIGPAVFVDMAKFARIYLQEDADASIYELAFQLFYSFLLPQFEGISIPQGRELFSKVRKLVGRTQADRLRATFAGVLGVDLPTTRINGEEDLEGDWQPDDNQSDESFPGAE